MTISLCYIVHNDLPMLRCVLPYEQRWADQICILDLGSIDGLEDYCLHALREGDRYLRRETNTVPEEGFAQARNACSALATSDWVVHANANMLLEWSDVTALRRYLASTTNDVMTTRTRNLVGLTEPWRLEQLIHQPQGGKAEHHRSFFRRSSGICYRGYIHEELYRGEVNVYRESASIPVTRYHFEGSGNHELRSWRYGWMLYRAYRKDLELQKYTNDWWYTVYCPEHEAALAADAAKYEEYVASTGLK